MCISWIDVVVNSMPLLTSHLCFWIKGLSYLHGVRHLVNRDIKPANLLINLQREPKITDFGINAGLENSMAMVHIFMIVGYSHLRINCDHSCTNEKL